MKTYSSIKSVRLSNPLFFSKDVMEHLDSRIETALLPGNMFVSSERPAGSEERRYTVRRAVQYKLESQPGRTLDDIVNVGAYGEYATKNEALAACREHARLIRLRGEDLLRAMFGAIRHPDIPGGVTLLALPGQGARLIASSVETEDPEAPKYSCDLVFSCGSELVETLATGPSPVGEAYLEQLLQSSGAQRFFRAEVALPGRAQRFFREGVTLP